MYPATQSLACPGLLDPLGTVWTLGSDPSWKASNFGLSCESTESCRRFLTGSVYMVLQGIAPWRYRHWHLCPGGKKDQELFFSQKHQFWALSSMAISRGQNPQAGSQRMVPMSPPTHTLSSRSRQWLPGIPVHPCDYLGGGSGELLPRNFTWHY